jgi:flagellar motor protein MotB
MNDTNGAALSALAAALAPYLAQHFGGNGAQGNPTAQSGGAFGSPQTGGALNTAFAGNQAQQQQAAAQVQQGGVAGNMFGGGNPQGTQQQSAAPAVTADMIQQLITPLVQNEQVKAALTTQMQQMGIQNLPDARPEQMAELYARFQQVDQQARQAGLIGAPAGGSPSII